MHGRLDAMNFFLADVRGGLGAFVSVFLVTAAGWSAAEVGAVLTVSGLIGIAALTPVGALIDATRAKRALLVGAVALLAACSVAIARWPTRPVVFMADVTMAVLGGVFAPTVAALTLGLVRESDLAHRLGRNAAWDRIGNLSIAALVGAVGWWWSQTAPFYLVPAFAVVAAAVVLSIPAHAIDHERARGFAPLQHEHRAEGMWRLLRESPGLVLLSMIATTFHFANGAMLPLLGQKLGLAHPGAETALMSAAIIVAQAVSIPVAILAGWRAEVWGLRTLLAVACVALVVRGCVFAMTNSAPLLLAAQALDGLAAGIWDVLLPLMLADLVVGSGRYSTTRGMLGTIQGIGGSISNGFAGVLVACGGYAVAFAGLAMVAASTLVLIAWLPAPEAVKRVREAEAI